MLKVLSLFSGIGAFEKALVKLGILHKIVNYCEIEPHASKCYAALNNISEDLNLWDVNKVDTKDIGDIDLLTHGSPCFLKGEQINTINGFTKIEDVAIGDMVKSHDGTYNEVIETMVSKNNNIFDIKCSAVHNINTTFNHPFYVLRDGSKQWIESKDLNKNDFMLVPINKNQNEIQWDGCELYYNNHTETSNKLPFDDNRFWYLIGRFIGDGWVVRRNERNGNISGIKVCCGKHEIDELKNKIGDLFNYCLVEDRTTYKLQFTNKELGVFAEQFGVGAINKCIPQHILDLKNEYLEMLLEGIIDSDGCFCNDKYSVSSISKTLIYNIGELVLKLKKVPYQIYKSKKSPKCTIENRVVNQHDAYIVNWRNDKHNKNINYVDDCYLYSRIRKINCRIELLDVYNIEVKNTHTYCVNNIATHNCQSFSLAGKQEGGEKGSGTKSSLLWESIRIIKDIKPKYVIWENVKNVTQGKHATVFNEYLDVMSSFGYTNSYKVLNAKEYGIPQARERVFVVSTLSKETFKFPLPVPLKFQLEDVLDFRSQDDLTFNFIRRYNTKNNTNIGEEEFAEYINSLPETKGIGGKYMKLYDFGEMDFITSSKGITGTLTCRNVQNYNKKYWYNNKLYKPSPLMVWLLMGFSKEDFNKVLPFSKDKDLYNRGGNSIVVDVVEAIYKELFEELFFVF